MTVDQVRVLSCKALVGKWPMARVGRAMEKVEKQKQGFMNVKLLVVAADAHQMLGAVIFEVERYEAVHTIFDIMSA